MTTEIPEKFWRSFCEQLKDRYRGVVSIRWVKPGGVTHFVIDNMPLQSLVFEKHHDACSDTMTVETGEPGENPHQYHQIVEPFCVILRQDEESRRYNELEILAETGRTEITFMPGIDSGLVDKLAA